MPASTGPHAVLAPTSSPAAPTSFGSPATPTLTSSPAVLASAGSSDAAGLGDASSACLLDAVALSHVPSACSLNFAASRYTSSTCPLNAVVLGDTSTDCHAPPAGSLDVTALDDMPMACSPDAPVPAALAVAAPATHASGGPPATLASTSSPAVGGDMVNFKSRNQLQSATRRKVTLLL